MSLANIMSTISILFLVILIFIVAQNGFIFKYFKEKVRDRERKRERLTKKYKHVHKALGQLKTN